MVKTKDEIMEEIRTYIGERNDDETISLIENISDTLDSVDTTGYEEKLRKIEDEWRRRYIDRFMNGGDNDSEAGNNANEKSEDEISIEDLYEEKEEK